MIRVMAQLQLRPQSVGGIIDATFTLYRRRFGPMIAVGVLLILIPFVISLIGGCTLEGNQTRCDSAIGWIGMLGINIGSILAAAGATYVAAEAYAGMPPEPRRAAVAGLRNIVSILVATIVVVVIVGLGFALLIVPGIFLLISFAVFIPALMIERIGPMASLKRSWGLVSGNRGRLFGAGVSIIIIAVIAFGVSWVIIFMILGVIFSEGTAAHYTQTLVTLLTVPLSASVGTALYLDLRVRKEDLSTDELSALLARVD